MIFADLLFGIICGLIALPFIGVAVWAFNRRSPMPFFAGGVADNLDPEDLTDVKAYNKAIGSLWLCGAIGFVISGVVSIFSMTVGIVALLIVCIPGTIILIVGYNRIYSKYFRQPSAKSPITK